jgi:hypothetical protein
MMRQDRFTEQAQEVLAALIRHPERSEGSGAGWSQPAPPPRILRCAQNDSQCLR